MLHWFYHIIVPYLWTWYCPNFISKTYGKKCIAKIKIKFNPWTRLNNKTTGLPWTTCTPEPEVLFQKSVLTCSSSGRRCGNRNWQNRCSRLQSTCCLIVTETVARCWLLKQKIIYNIQIQWKNSEFTNLLLIDFEVKYLEMYQGNIRLNKT